MDFESSVENIDEVTRQLKVSIPADTYSKEFDAALNKLTKTVSLKGFRPGKAPKQLVEKLHGDRVRYDVVNKLISDSITKVVDEKKIDMVGSPTVDINSIEPGKQLEFTAKLSVFPKPEVQGYEKIKVQVEKRDVSDEEIDKTIENLRSSKATLRKLEFRNVAQKGDVFDGTIAIQDASGKWQRAEPVTVPVGEGRLPEEVEEAIVGMEVGQTKDVGSKDDKVKGYRLVLSGLSEKVLPEVNDEFAKSVELFQAQTLLELRMKVREQLEQRLKEERKADLHVAILDELLKHNEFQVPEVLIDDEIQGLLYRSGLIPPGQEPNAEMVEKFKAGLQEVAQKRVRSAIVVDRIGELEKLKAEKDDIEKYLAEAAKRHNVDVDTARRYFLDGKNAIGFVMEVTRNKVLEFLEGRAEVEYVEKKEDEKDATEKSA